MHVLVVTQYFWPENFRINDIVSGLHERGHQVTVLTGHPNYPSGQFQGGYTGRRTVQEQYQGIRVIRVPMLARGKGSGVKLALNYLSYALSASLLGPLLIRQRPDVIFVYEPSPMTVGFPAMVMKARTGRPIAFYLQDLWPESLVATGFVSNPALLKGVEWMVRFIYAACDRILVTSRAFTDRVVRLGYRRERVVYYPQYAEAFYAPRPPGTPTPVPLPDGFTVMFAGNMGTAQDLFTVLRAAELTQADGIQWVFLGDGSVRSELQARAEEKHLNNVHFLGSFPATDMPAFFAHADALLISLNDEEIFELTVPAKLQSYLACGRPVLGSLSGEGADLVREAGAGHCVSPGNPDALAEAARALQATPETERQQMAARGRAYFEQHFEREKLLDQLEHLLSGLARTGGQK